MNAKFQFYIDQLEPKFQALISMTPVSITALPRSMPQAGIYVFYEKDEPLYVGRTNRMKARLKYHSSPHAHDAPFAFRLARIAIGQTQASYRVQGSRKELLTLPKFRKAFAAAKARIQAMDIRFVEEEDQIKQTLLEVYAAVLLGTPHNDFKTH